MTTDVGHTYPGRRGPIPFALQHRFAILLCALALLLIGAPLVRVLGPGTHPRLVSFAITSFFSAVLLSAVFAVSRTRVTKNIALLLAIPAVLAQGLETWFADDGFAVAAHILGILFLGYAVTLVLKFLFAGRRVSSDMICASLCVYLLLGTMWAHAYSMFYVLDQTSFAFSFVEEGGLEVMRFGGEQTFIAIYYSFVTMSTLGYGDIVPLTAPARTCAALQAIVGQLYLAVLVARLVGLHVSQASEGKQEIFPNE